LGANFLSDFLGERIRSGSNDYHGVENSLGAVHDSKADMSPTQFKDLNIKFWGANFESLNFKFWIVWWSEKEKTSIFIRTLGVGNYGT